MSSPGQALQCPCFPEQCLLLQQQFNSHQRLWLCCSPFFLTRLQPFCPSCPSLWSHCVPCPELHISSPMPSPCLWSSSVPLHPAHPKAYLCCPQGPFPTQSWPISASLFLPQHHLILNLTHSNPPTLSVSSCSRRHLEGWRAWR